MPSSSFRSSVPKSTSLRLLWHRKCSRYSCLADRTSRAHAAALTWRRFLSRLRRGRRKSTLSRTLLLIHAWHARRRTKCAIYNLLGYKTYVKRNQHVPLFALDTFSLDFHRMQVDTAGASKQAGAVFARDTVVRGDGTKKADGNSVEDDVDTGKCDGAQVTTEAVQIVANPLRRATQSLPAKTSAAI
eukprot:3872025-Pleurochrysis_carterae.AAC.1